MDYVLLWFVMTAGANIPPYIEPMRVPMNAPFVTCNLVGAVAGVTFDRAVNPTIAIWPDPHVADRHCHVDIAARVLSLGPGEYHFATTEVGDGSSVPYIGIDPHTSSTWIRSNAPTTIVPPAKLTIKPPR